MTAHRSPIRTVCCLISVSDTTLAKLKELFPTVLYRPDGTQPSEEETAQVDMWISTFRGLPWAGLELEDLKQTKIIQLMSAGAGLALQMPALQSPEGRKQITLCSASGVHVYSIPQFIISQVISFYRKLYAQTHVLRTEERWLSRDDISTRFFGGAPIITPTLFGKTVGFLGYGHIARETARELAVWKVRIIAANSNGQRRVDDGYDFPGLGDRDGSLPSAYYSTASASSFRDFLSQSDILICSLPSTPATQFLLTPQLLSYLPSGSVLVNVGRGDLVRSEDLLAALDKTDKDLLKGEKGGLNGVILDVTDPEPLPDHHPLFSHPRAIVTPHTSGDFEGYMDVVAEFGMEQARRLNNGEKLFNVVDYEKGY